MGLIIDTAPQSQPLPKANRRYNARLKQKSGKLRPNTFDLKKIASWAEVGCTLEEMAAMLNVEYNWFKHQASENPELQEAIYTAVGNMKRSLRHTQTKLALQGHPGMLIWLGKQYLGQRDQQEVKQETTVNVVLQRAMEELRELDSDTIIEMKRLLEKKEEPVIIDNQ